MKRQSMVAYGEPLTETEIATPEPTGTQVLLRVTQCGVCHSDLHLHEGHFDLGEGKQLDVKAGRTLPFTLGHEIAAEVAKFGPEATGVSPGQRFAVYAWIGCGECSRCARGDEHLCEVQHHIGIYEDGGYATHVMVPHPRYLIPIDGVDPLLAGSYMCSGLTTFSALKKVEKPMQDGPLLLLGMGGLGMMALQFAKAMTSQPIIAADIAPAKREAALALGAAMAVDPTDREARKAVLSRFGKIAAATDYVGTPETIGFATGLLGRGASIVVVGLMGGKLSLSSAMFPLRPMSLIGTYAGSLPEAHAMMDMVRAGKIAPIPVDRRPMTEVNQALTDLAAGRVTGRVVLTP
ncbi:D-arabinose 1-dehydrogenase-like Zn-dependent alcohol dehydrogenase [Rhodoligotrophos appendicifer]|uniref:alcohol dehydrogenase n=1 Tax=Rhodoligotrophos appendicifer TaxID=987056 RepID=UPI0011852D48|nr:alcohol dehydrogenase [Rhodoligotrophos appendicifer]